MNGSVWRVSLRASSAVVSRYDDLRAVGERGDESVVAFAAGVGAVDLLGASVTGRLRSWIDW